MTELKGYQKRALGTLSDFLERCARGTSPAEAFAQAQAKAEAPTWPYRTVSSEGLPAEMPYACLRVPTGGGKTLMACHAAGLALKAYLRVERGVVLWLVPSSPILEQTAKALRDARHPYRRALEDACGGVEVVTIEEALRLSRAAMDGATVVIVATIQAFRASDPMGRRVYAQNGSFLEQLQHAQVDGLLPGPDGKPLPSLVNALRLRRPVVIVDEAHNARSPLSLAALGDVRPSCVLEFTATPAREANPSNVLHQVSAAEMKAADMAKLPIRVVTRHPGQREELLAEAVSLRRNLEKLAEAEAQATGEYIRPILLIQAERVDDCSPLKKKLIDELGFSEPEVKISVGDHEELEKAGDLSVPGCPVRAVITVQRLREGWDCPFAYVLCSLRDTRSPTAAEQIVGRIMRLPRAKAKATPALNCAYVFSVSPAMDVILAELRDALVANGFTPAEAGQALRPEPQSGFLPLSLGARSAMLPAAHIDAARAASETSALGGKATIDAGSGEIKIFVPLDDAEVERLAACVSTPAAKQEVRGLAAAVKAADVLAGGTGETRAPSPWERGAEFSVPRLSVKEPSGLLEFEEALLLERSWRLSDKDASLPGYDPKARPKGSVGALDVAATGKVITESLAGEESEDFLSALHRQMRRLGVEEEWTREKLVVWLDWRIRHPDVPMEESTAFLEKAVRGLIAAGGDPAELGRDRFRLREAIERRVAEHRVKERGEAFQAYLGGPELAVDPALAFDFRLARYEPGWLYEGDHRFRTHYFGAKPGELEERTPAGALKEEFRCAVFIDCQSEVEFWARNLPRKPGSFRLLTADGWFYPDFVAKLKDGRILVVEYKGEHLLEAAKPKLAVGYAWAKRSGGRCLFVMPTRADFSEIRAAIDRR